MNNIYQFNFQPYILLRAPAYSYNCYKETSPEDLLKDAYFIDAIYHASDSLYDAIEKTKKTGTPPPEKMHVSLLKYFNRMCFRATPFGTMASITSATWGDAASKVILNDERLASVQPSFSDNIQHGLSILRSKSKNDLVYEVNPGLYGETGMRRYLKYTADKKEKKRSFHIESIAPNPALERIINFLSKPMTFESLYNFLTKELQASGEIAESFLDELAEAQIIRCLQEPNITGENYIARMCRFRNVSNHVKITKGQAAYVNQTRKTDEAFVSMVLQAQIREGLQAVYALTAHASTDALSTFKNEFREKFDLRLVPLLEALDPEMGIDYSSLTAPIHNCALLDGVHIQTANKETTNLAWTKVHRTFMEKWPHVKDNKILLTEADLKNLQPDNNANFPNSMSVLFRLLNDEVYLENAGNASANALLGRFTLQDNECLKAAQDLAAAEEAANPDVIFAEIAHFSGLHVANIEQRACLYSYEIPIAAGSEYDDSHRLALSDLHVFLRQDELILFSKKHNRRVIPRLSTALNYSKSDLPVFRFLCDLQHQSINTVLAFSPELFFPGLHFYPRIQYNNTILSLATWYITCTDNASHDDISALAKNLQWPRYVSVNQHDHQLVFDMTDMDDISLLGTFWKQGTKLTIKEFPFIEDNSPVVKDNHGKPYINQFVASIFHQEQIYDNYLPPVTDNDVKRSFQPGSEWLYLKLNCSPLRSNNILTEYIAPALAHLREHDCISKFFFVRYNSPSHHLRIRLLLTSTVTVGSTIKVLERYLAPLVDSGTIQGFSFETYQRELERYHPKLIDTVESFFCASSDLVLNYLQQTTHSDNEAIYYRIAFAGIEALLDKMEVNSFEREQFFRTLFFGFAAEFALTAELKQALSDKYRLVTDNNQLTKLFYFAEDSAERALVETYNESIGLINKTCQQHNPEDKMKLIADLVHMHLNRCFIEHPRKQELTFYYIMNRHYMSVCARLKSQSVPVSSIN